jgi:hypothetical protein
VQEGAGNGPQAGTHDTVDDLPHDAVVRVDKRVEEISRADKRRCSTRGEQPSASSGDDTRLATGAGHEPAASLHRGRCRSGASELAAVEAEGAASKGLAGAIRSGVARRS